MSSLDKVLGWFPHIPTEWIEFIVVAVLLWLLMVVAELWAKVGDGVKG